MPLAETRTRSHAPVPPGLAVPSRTGLGERRNTYQPTPLDTDAAALFAHWTRELGLSDWKIKLEVVPDLMSSDGHPVYGLCYPLAEARHATLVLRSPDTYPPGSDPAQLELTIVHELSHLHWAALELTDRAHVIVEEQAVWATAAALVSARRGGAIRAARSMRIATKTTRIRAAKAPEKTSMLSSKSIDFFLELAADKKYADAAKAVLREIMGAAAPEEEPASEEAPPAEPPAAKMDEEPAKAAKVDPDAELGRAALAFLGVADHAAAVELLRARRVAELEGVEAPKADALEARYVAVVKRMQAPALRLETPASSGLASGKICERIRSQKIEDLEAHVERMEKLVAAGAKDISPPKRAAHAVLTEKQMQICKETGCDPDVFAARIKARKV